MSQEKWVSNLHLLRRAGFGPAVADLPLYASITPSKLVSKLLNDSEEVRPVGISESLQKIRDFGKIRELSREDRAELRRMNRAALQELNLRWLDEMVQSPAQLREKMAFFWHGHFACREVNAPFQQQLLDVIRTHALGDFKTLLREVSKAPAMLAFLNNQQNRKQQPNENFAREVMELFTMGRGQYSETDIREAARAFTGWGFERDGQFVFRRFFHDTGVKTVLGKTGNFNGDDVLNILLEQKQTAYYIAGKIYRFFVDLRPDPQRIKALGDAFYASGYDIADLVSKIFTSDWFYDKRHIGTIVKSPVELMVGTRRLLPMTMQQPSIQLYYQRLLGQLLFYPPNVAGWPGGRDWIDSSSLMYRMRIPRLLQDNEQLQVKPKDDDDVMMGMMERRQVRRAQIQVEIKWDTVLEVLGKVRKEELSDHLATCLLPGVRPAEQSLAVSVDRTIREGYIRTLMRKYMSCPEFQLM
jgi:uncharacterized protein (DUF1800 family)